MRAILEDRLFCQCTRVPRVVRRKKEKGRMPGFIEITSAKVINNIG